jgi:quinol monooxygenase YgiN
MDGAWNPDQVVLIGTFRIPQDKVDDWRVAVRGMADFVHANVPRIIAFDMFVTEDGTEGTVIQVHPDSASLEQHLDAAASRIAQGIQMVSVVRIDLYGSPNPGLIKRLRDEAAGLWPVTVRPHYLGFARTGDV